MLIISKFRDYYDASVGYGIDKTIVFNRTTSIIKSDQFFLEDSIADNNMFFYWNWINKPDNTHKEWRIIGFCGKTYVLLIEFLKIEGLTTIKECFYGMDALEPVFKNQKKHWRYKETKAFIDQWHEVDFVDFFLNNNCPVFSVQPSTSYLNSSLDVILNPSLSEFKFFRIFDSYSAFQNIQMFISGVLGTGGTRTAEVSDTDKIKQYGFDLKWSFRNPDPPKRKQIITGSSPAFPKYPAEPFPGRGLKNRPGNRRILDRY